MAQEHIPPVHPGRHLAEFLADSAVSPCRMAGAIGVSKTRIYAILNGKHRVTTDTALRLAKYFGQSDNFWVLLQAKYDTEIAQREIAPDLANIAALESAAPNPAPSMPL